MLAALETLFLPALRTALGGDADLRGGPATAPAAGQPARLSLWAERLVRDGSEGDDPARDPVQAAWEGLVSADPSAPLDFPLPEAARGDVAEVQSPPGHLLPPGDAWQLDGRTLRFFRAPAGPVRVSTRSEPVRGYRERRPGRVELSLRVWAADGAAALAAAPAVSAPRWRQKAWLLAGGLLWLLFLLAMSTHSGSDAAFSTSGTGEPLRNKAGLLGARVSDMALFLFGYSAWWLVPVSARAWLSGLATLLRGPSATPRPPRLLFWIGLLLLVAASCALEWTRLYQWESRLPDHAGGVLGYTLGPLSMKLLGFAGSGVLWIAALLAGLAMAFRFSWLGVAERIGARLEGVREQRARGRLI